MLNAALSVQDAHAKALASFLFREIVEDAHEKYNIFQEDMKELRVWNGMIRRKRSSWRKKWMCCAPLLNRELPPARFGGAPGGVLISFNPPAPRALPAPQAAPQAPPEPLEPRAPPAQPALPAPRGQSYMRNR